MEIFAVKWNVVSDTSIREVLLSDIFAKLDGSSGINN